MNTELKLGNRIIRSVGHPKLYLFVGKKVVMFESWVTVGKKNL